MAINAIVCGTIRSDLEAYLVFQDLIAGRAQGIIGRIVYCTWPDQVEQAPRFIRQLTDSGVEILTTPLRKPANFYNIQVLPFYTALSLFEDDDFVVRARTDKCFPLVRTLIQDSAALLEKSLTISADSIFRSRIVIAAMSLNELFAHADFFMLARAGDLRKICHFDSFYDVFCAQVGPESRWFANPYIQNYPDLRAVFEAVPVKALALALHRWSRKPLAEKETLPRGLGRVIGQYAYLCSRDLALMNENVLAPELTLPDAYAGRDPSRWQWGPRDFVTSHNWLRRIAAGTQLGELGEYAGWAATADLRRRSLTPDDLNGIRAFTQTHTAKAIKTVWPGLHVKMQPPEAAQRDHAGGLFRSGLAALATTIDPAFDPAWITEDIVALEQKFTAYPKRAHLAYRQLCRDTGLKIVSILQAKFAGAIPRPALILPALFFASSLVSAWDGVSGEWLADQLLADRLNPYFGAVTRYGLAGRQQTPEIMFKAALLVRRGIGGPVDEALALRLLRNAADRGFEQAREALSALEKDAI